MCHYVDKDNFLACCTLLLLYTLNPEEWQNEDYTNYYNYTKHTKLVKPNYKETDE